MVNMEKNVISSCTDSEEMEMQRLQKKARIMKDSCINGLSVLKSKFTIISKKDVPGITASEFEHAFSQELHESDCQTAFRVLKTPFEKIFTSVLIQTSSLDEIKQRMNAKKFQIQECKVYEVKASDASSGDKDSSGTVSDKGNDQSLENQSSTTGDESNRSRNECNDKSTSGDDTNIRPSYGIEPMAEVPYTTECNVFAVESQHPGQPENNADNHESERVMLADLIANLKLDFDENKRIQKHLTNANALLTQELKECKSTLEETNRTLGKSNSTRDSCLIALQNKEIELEKYKTYLNHTTEYDTLERKLKETQTVLAQKENDIKEGLKLKAYEISVVKKEHDELVKQSLLTKSSYEDLVKEKNQVIKDSKLKEENDIDKLITMEKQSKFLNEIVYKRNQSIQTIHMLAPKGSTYNGRPTFANPMYLKKAQSKKAYL
ncbi:hypothetical protein Tco_0086756 [Tanacetum coccineum]